MSDTYTLSLKFEGLCVLVDNPDETVTVLLVDGTKPGGHHGTDAVELGDGTVSHDEDHSAKHIPMIVFDKASLVTPEQELPEEVRFVESRPRHWDGEWTLAYEDLALGFGAGTEPTAKVHVEKFADVKKSTRRPTGGNGRDYSWIPDLQILTNDSCFVRPACVVDRNPARHRVVARMVLTTGRLGAAHDIDGSPLIYFASPDTPRLNADKDYVKRFATYVELRIEGLRAPLRVHAMKFDGSRAAHVTLRPTGDELTVIVRNALPRNTNYKAPVKDGMVILEHFTMLYDVAESAPAKPLAPVYPATGPQFPGKTCLSGGRMRLR